MHLPTDRTITRSRDTSNRRRAVGFVRVSTSRQAQIGIPEQIASIRAFSKHADLDLLAIFGDPHTGMRPSAYAENKELGEAIELAEAEGALLVVADVTRLGRQPDVGVHISNRGLSVLSIREGRVLSAAELLSALGAARGEGRRIQERTKKALGRARERGKKLGNPALSAARVRAQIVRRSSADARAEAAAAIFGSLEEAKRLSREEAAELLNSRGLKTARSNRFDRSRVRRVLDRVRALLAEEVETDEQ